MMGILFYLSHNAEVPQPHQAAGLVTQTQSAEGEAFDWNEVTGGLSSGALVHQPAGQCVCGGAVSRGVVLHCGQ